MNRSLAIALGIAAIGHAVVIGAVRPMRHAIAPVAVQEPVDTIEVYAEADDRAPVNVPPAAPAGGTMAPSPQLGIVAKSKSTGTVKIEVPAASSSEPIASAPSAGPATTGDTPKTKFPSLINLDSPGSHGVIFPSASSSADGPVAASNDTKAQKEKAAATKLDTQLKSMLDAKDTETGSGFGGPVVSVAHSVAGSNGAMGYATFDVSTDALGAVTLVRVVDFGGDSKGWQAMAKELHASLSSRKLRVPTGATGVSVRIRIEADMKYPSGATKPISPMTGGIGANFDVADIGQPKKRSVSVRIVSEQRI